MKKWLPLASVLPIGLLLWAWSTTLMEKEHQQMLRRLVDSTQWLIKNGHQQKDDLLIQQTVQAIGASSGVLYAAVVDPSRKAIAHSDAAKLGKSFRATRGRSYSFDLKEGDVVWGRLCIGLAEAPYRQASQGWALILTASLFFVGLLWAWQLLRNEKRIAELTRDCSTLQNLIKEAEGKRLRAEALTSKERESARLSLAEALRSVSEPVLVLDENQKVAAFTSPLPRALEERSDDLLGKAWHDVRWLEELGPALEESLSRPQAAILTGTPERRFRIVTLKDRSASWVALL